MDELHLQCFGCRDRRPVSTVRRYCHCGAVSARTIGDTLMLAGPGGISGGTTGPGREQVHVVRPSPVGTSVDPSASPATRDVEAGEGGQEGRALEVHGCLAIGGSDLERTTYPGGPTLVRGVRALIDEGGDAVELTRNVVAICRCGKSQLRPFCDGTHRFVPDLDGSG